MGDMVFNVTADCAVAPLDHDCKFLESLLDDCFRSEIEQEHFYQVELLRELATAVTRLSQKKDSESADYLAEKLLAHVRDMSLEKMLPVARACGHYLNLIGIAEMHHHVRQQKKDGMGARSFKEVFAKILSAGISQEKLHEAVCQHRIEIVVTAHPTQIVRRSLQYKLAKIAALLDQRDRPDLTQSTVEHVLNDLKAEVMALWHTQEFRTMPPTVFDEVRGGLSIVEQSLWNAVPEYLIDLNSALKEATGYDLPVHARVVTFASWMGGDKEENPAITAKIIRLVAYLARWIALDLYLREIDALRFELSMHRCSGSLLERAKTIAEKNRSDHHDVFKDDSILSRFNSNHQEHRVLFPSDGEGTIAGPHILPYIPEFCRKSSDAVAHEEIDSAHINGDGHVAKISVETPITASESSESAATSPPISLQRRVSKKKVPKVGSQAKVDAILNPIRMNTLDQDSQPYRIILTDIRRRLVHTKRKMEELLGGPHLESGDIYHSATEFREILLEVYDSLKSQGMEVIANGRLLDLIRRVTCFGLSLMKMDIREASQRHLDTMDEVTQYLLKESYTTWDETRRMEFLTKELNGRRPLISRDIMSEKGKEVLDTFVVAAELGNTYLGAYVIGQPTAPSDVLLVELFQREAAFILALQNGTKPKLSDTLRVVPAFDTLKGLESAGEILQGLFANPWYRERLRSPRNDNTQEVLLGYCDSQRDACRFSATWALYKTQEQLVKLCKKEDVALTVLYGRGGTMGRWGGAPLWQAIQSQPPGAIQGSLRLIEQGEMIQAKFGVPAVAIEQMETCAGAVIHATLLRPHDCQASVKSIWLESMMSLSAESHSVFQDVMQQPKLDSYFHHVTPEFELPIADMDPHFIDIEEKHVLKPVPWTFRWTQTRHVFPSWLGVGQALQKSIDNGQLALLQEMYKEWPLFHSILDLIEMILAKVDMRIASVYDETLVEDEEEREIGSRIRESYEITVSAISAVTGHRNLCDHNAFLSHLLSIRNAFLYPINLFQIKILKELRSEPEEKTLKDALMITINGVAAGMRNTG